MKINAASIRALVFLAAITAGFTTPLCAEAQNSNAPSQVDAQPETDPAEKLLSLARQKFGTLTPAEESLFRGVAQGKSVTWGTGSKREADPSSAVKWRPERALRAETIAWLCTDQQAAALITHRGIMITGASVDGLLSLQNVRVPFPLGFINCAFQNDIDLQFANVRYLLLRGSHTQSVIASGLTADNAVFMDGLVAEGEVDLDFATIGAGLDCYDAHFMSGGKTALSAQGIKVTGEFFLNNIVATNRVLLTGATVTGNLECDGAQLNNEGGVALYADEMRIEGSAFLRNGFKSEGEVNLRGTSIEQDLDCTVAKFMNAGANALSADEIKVGGAVRLGDIEAQGKIVLTGSRIGQNLECDGAHLSNPGSSALIADGINVEGYVFLRNGFRAEGEVNLLAATIGRNLECDGAEFINAHSNALYADGMNVGGNVFLKDGFAATGEVSFVCITVGGNLLSSGSQFINAGGDALFAPGCKINGNFWLVNGFQVQGDVNLAGATVGHYFMWRDILPNSNVSLNLSTAKIGTLMDEQGSWPMSGGLSLDGFVYDEIGPDAPTDADNRIHWLHLQPAENFLPQPYEQLASVLRKEGHDDDAREVLIAKNRDWAQRVTWLHPIRWWYWLLDESIRYGYRPWRAFAESLIIITLVGWPLFYVGQRHKLLTPTKEEGTGNYPRFSALIYSLETFVPLINLHVAEHWQLNGYGSTEFNVCGLSLPLTGKWLRRYYWFHIIMGWVLTTLWVGALTGLIKT